ncbi:histidine kinase [Chitinophaga niastensis]|uniref:Histidine kinase n=1 Tax=Chitinophaga niastensis TaxID=536980 RepID=A0A2P8H9I5_CHINA|nr:histidine kinase [Chitinophaga niastensis]PSL42829.1 histidine kinase [Chitinophaga niastensis]
MQIIAFLKKNKHLILHLLFWIILTVLSYFVAVIQENDGGVFFEDALGKYTTSSFIFYCNALFVFPRLFAHKRYTLVVFASFSVLFISYFLKCILYIYIFPVFDYPPIPYTLFQFFSMHLWWWIQYTLFGIGYWYTIQAHDIEKKKIYLEGEKMKTEFAYLSAKIDPHFLFNVLNVFYSKALSLSEELADNILTLADIMHYAISAEEEDGKTEISKELEQINNVIKINKMRFYDDIDVQFTIDGNFVGMRIIRFVLISLVENAFKHGELLKGKKPLIINIEFNEFSRSVNMIVINSKSNKPNWSSQGTGLENVKNRLTIEYGSRYSLNLKEDANTFKVDLLIYL